MEKLSIPYPTLGIDLDGTITENPLFFQVLSNNWPGNVVIITYRDDYNKAVKDLNGYFIKYDKLILSKNMDKSEIIATENINVYFDDQDEMTMEIPKSTTVLKIRNGGNFDFDDKKWLYSNNTGKRI